MDIKNVLMKTRKGIPAAALFLLILALAGTATAATLTYYGTIEGDGEIAQAVTFRDGSTSKSFNFDMVAGETVKGTYSLETNTAVATPIRIVADNFEGEDTNTNGLDVSYNLVTTAFAKGNASATWNAENVVLTINETKAPAVVLVPVMEELQNLNSLSVDSSNGQAYGQLMIDCDPDNADSNWAQAYKSNGNWSLYIYKSEGDFVYTNADLSQNEVVAQLPPSAKIVGVKAQLYKHSGSIGSNSDTVKSITFDGKTYDLDKDDRHESDVTGVSFEMPPLPAEEFDFNITVASARNLKPDNFELDTGIGAA